jgi:hypothetical protein
MDKKQIIISPKTKVLQLIETYPELEDILRKTVAKIATLQQAASIGNVKVGDLINHLRQEVGQELMTSEINNPYNTRQPDWFNEANIVQELDVREMLAAGEHPVNQVMADLKKLPENTIYKMIAPFLPAPLIDKASSIEVKHWVVKEKEDLFIIYFSKS